MEIITKAIIYIQVLLLSPYNNGSFSERQLKEVERGTSAWNNISTKSVDSITRLSGNNYEVLPEESFEHEDYAELKKFGATGNGSKEDMLKIQQFFDYCSKNKIPGLVNKGEYLLTSPVYIGSNTNVKFENGASFTRAFVGNTSVTGSTIQQKNPREPIENVKLTGFVMNLKNNGFIGRPITLHANDVALESMRINGFVGALAMVLAGNNIVVNNAYIHNSLGKWGEGGIRFQGGTNLVCTNSYVESGDDCFQFVPSASPNDPLFNMDISNGRFENCEGKSTSARIVVVFKEENNTCTVKNVKFINIRGQGGQRQMVIQDQSKFELKALLSKSGSNAYKIESDISTNRNFPWFNNGDSVIIKSKQFGNEKMVRGKINKVGSGYLISASESSNSEVLKNVFLTKVNSGKIEAVYVLNFHADAINDTKNESIIVENIDEVNISGVIINNNKGRIIVTKNIQGNFEKPLLRNDHVP